MSAEEHGVKKPSEIDSPVAARTDPYAKGDKDAVADYDFIQERRRASRNRARARKKQNKMYLAAWVERTYGTGDSNTDNEDS